VTCYAADVEVGFVVTSIKVARFDVDVVVVVVADESHHLFVEIFVR